jgi:DNA-binding MarR family transcriptional regulator
MNLLLIFGIHRTTHRIGLYIQRHATDLNQAEAHILCHLLESGDSAIADLHRAFAHRRSTLTSVLDRLTARGLATRDPNPDDRRSFIVRLTRSGSSKASKIHRRLESLEAEALRGMDRKAVEAFSNVLDSVERAAAVSKAPDQR